MLNKGKPDLNRKERRRQRKQVQQNAQRYGDRLRPVPRDEWPHISPKPVQVFMSKDYLVQIYDEPNDVKRISVSRASIKKSGGWADRLTWDELQQIKSDVGYGDYYAIEVYPRNKDVINVANIRHLWVLPEPLEIGWFNE